MIKDGLFNIYRYSFIFIELKDKSLESRSVFQGKSPYKTTVNWTSGKFYIGIPRHVSPRNISYQLHFNLNLKLRLNVTFLVLQLQGSISNCAYDKLEVISLKVTGSQYKYCGYHEHFNLYPEFNYFMISITLYLGKSFQLDSTYSVTDKHLIFNPHDNTKMGHLNYCVYTVGGRQYVTSFMIRTIKFFRVRLMINKSNIENYVVYDGPHYRFSILKAKGDNNTLVASTFQCYLQFLLNSDIYGQNNYDFHYSNAPNNKKFFKKIDTVSQIFITMPDTNCLSNFCIQVLQHTRGFSFNLSVINVFVHSHETSSCIFQGLYLGEGVYYNFDLNDEICSEIQPPSQSSIPNFYTRGSSLWMGLYWYEGYTSITTRVSVTVTSCKAVYLNICKYYYLCDTEEEFNIYLLDVTYHTNLILHAPGSFDSQLQFYMPPGDCVVMILSDKIDFSQKLNPYDVLNFCEITLVSTRGNLNNDIYYISGYLGEGNFMEMMGHKDCSSSKNPMCHRIVKDEALSEFFNFKFIDRFRKYIFIDIEVIDIVLVRIISRQVTNKVNILVIGRTEKNENIDYALSAHPLEMPISDLVLNFALQPRYAVGLDWLLSISTDLNLASQYKTTLCSVTIQRIAEIIFDSSDISKMFLGRVGKLLRIL